MNKEYNPAPILLSENAFSKEIRQLIELLAENVHEQWSAGKIKDGWKYGKQHNDRLKEHPSIVPYQELPESEKEYDRKTVIATLSLLAANGYDLSDICIKYTLQCP